MFGTLQGSLSDLLGLRRSGKPSSFLVFRYGTKMFRTLEIARVSLRESPCANLRRNPVQYRITPDLPGKHSESFLSILREIPTTTAERAPRL